MIRLIVPLLSVLVAFGAAPVAASQEQTSQAELARQIVQGDRDLRNKAVEAATTIGVPRMGPELRAALVTALVDEGKLNERVRRKEIAPLRQPEIIASIARLVGEFLDPSTIPALAGALRTFSSVFSLASFGEPAVQPVLNVLSTTADASVVMDALIILRLIVEEAGTRPLTTGTLIKITKTAETNLTADSDVTTLWRAIDLAIAVKAPALRRIVETLATDWEAVVRRGVTERDLIEKSKSLQPSGWQASHLFRDGRSHWRLAIA